MIECPRCQSKNIGYIRPQPETRHSRAEIGGYECYNCGYFEEESAADREEDRGCNEYHERKDAGDYD